MLDSSGDWSLYWLDEGILVSMPSYEILNHVKRLAC